MNKNWKIIAGTILVLLCLLVNCSLGFCYPAQVKSIIDGDTIELEDGTRLRYIGIDAPEVKRGKAEPYAQESLEANKKLVEGKEVWVEIDAQEYDKYGRLLAYVFVSSIFVNAWLVENGYAKVVYYPPNVKYYRYFRFLEKKAREKNLGIWIKISSKT
jgi:micrococcal nuclease